MIVRCCLKENNMDEWKPDYDIPTDDFLGNRADFGIGEDEEIPKSEAEKFSYGETAEETHKRLMKEQADQMLLEQRLFSERRKMQQDSMLDSSPNNLNNRRNEYGKTAADNFDDMVSSLPWVVGALFGVAVAYMLGCDIMTYPIFAAIGFYGGAFVKLHAFDNYPLSAAFEHSKPSLFIALATIVIFLLVYLFA